MEEGLEEILECSCGLDVHKDKIEAFEKQRLAAKPWLAHTM